jgi:hypothetical protein
LKGEINEKDRGIMAVSLMLLASCGQIKELVGINKSSEGSETIGAQQLVWVREQWYQQQLLLSLQCGASNVDAANKTQGTESH